MARKKKQVPLEPATLEAIPHPPDTLQDAPPVVHDTEPPPAPEPKRIENPFPLPPCSWCSRPAKMGRPAPRRFACDAHLENVFGDAPVIWDR